jgi:hypothetical protein
VFHSKDHKNPGSTPWDLFFGVANGQQLLLFSQGNPRFHTSSFFFLILLQSSIKSSRKLKALHPKMFFLGSKCLRGKLNVHFSERTWGSTLWVFWVSHAFYSWGEENSKDWSPCFKKIQSSNNWVGHVSHFVELLCIQISCANFIKKASWKKLQGCLIMVMNQWKHCGLHTLDTTIASKLETSPYAFP